MDVASIAASVIGMQQAVAVNNLQMAMLKSNMEAQAGVLTLLEGAAQGTANPAHLGNLVDTSA